MYNSILTASDSYTYAAEGQVTQKIVSDSDYLNSSLSLSYDEEGYLKSIWKQLFLHWLPIYRN